MKVIAKTFLMLFLILSVVAVVSPTGVIAQGDHAAPMININTASVDELTELDRILLKHAQKIVDYRKTEGPFQRPEDIMRVWGISPTTYEMNKSSIAVK